MNASTRLRNERAYAYAMNAPTRLRNERAYAYAMNAYAMNAPTQ